MTMKNRTDADILIDYIKTHSVSTPHSEEFAERIESLFYIKAQKGALKKIELDELESRIHLHKMNTGTYPTDLVFKYNRIYNNEKPPLTCKKGWEFMEYSRMEYRQNKK